MAHLPIGATFAPIVGNESGVRRFGSFPGNVGAGRAVQLLRLRLPDVLGPRALAPSSLLTAPGGAGLPIAGVLTALLKQLIGTPEPQTFPTLPSPGISSPVMSTPFLPTSVPSFPKPVPSFPTITPASLFTNPSASPFQRVTPASLFANPPTPSFQRSLPPTLPSQLFSSTPPVRQIDESRDIRKRLQQVLARTRTQPTQPQAVSMPPLPPRVIPGFTPNAPRFTRFF